MNTAPSPSLFDRTVARPRPAWATALLVLAVYLPTLVAVASMGLSDILAGPQGRSILTSPTAIAYILVIAQIISNVEPNVVRLLRPVILVDDRELARVVRRASSIPPIHEVAAIAVGLFFGFLISGGPPRPGTRWQEYVSIATGYVMCGLLAWLGYTLLAKHACGQPSAPPTAARPPARYHAVRSHRPAEPGHRTRLRRRDHPRPSPWELRDCRACRTPVSGCCSRPSSSYRLYSSS